MNFIDPASVKGTFIRKYGRNLDVDTATDPETIWEVGGAYTGWVAAAATTTVVSDSADDDGDPDSNTGAHTVLIEGLDTNLRHVVQSATLNGTSAVTLPVPLYRCYRAYVDESGSGSTNAGNIQVKHGSTVLAQITAGQGQTLQAVYTTPLTAEDGTAYKRSYLYGYSSTLTKNTNVAVEMELRFRPYGGSWRVFETWGMVQSGGSNVGVVFPSPISIGLGTDLEIRCFETSANDASVSAHFDVVLMK